MNSEILLSFLNVSKTFDGVHALKDVQFDVKKGECLALCGENGAGKSTLMKILSGVWPAGTYDGEVRFQGKALALKTPLDGRREGISIIHQELCLFPKLTVAENLFLTEAFPYDGTPSQKLFAKVSWKKLNEKAEELFKTLGFQIDPQTTVEELSVAERQLVEIARAFHHDAKILILDEPTSALSQAEVKHLFKVIEQMRSKQMTFIYISHKLDEVFHLCDRIVVLRDGKSVASLDSKQTSEAEVIRHMVGRAVALGAHQSREIDDDTVLEVDKLSHELENGKSVLSNVSFALKKGEVVGIAGLMGAGRSELLRSMLGVLPGKRSGTVKYKGCEVKWDGTRSALEAGVAFVPEDRKKDGLFLSQPIAFNLTVSVLEKFRRKGGFLNLSKEKSIVNDLVSRFSVKCKQVEEPVKNLSGGNQQKVLLGKVVARSPEVIFLDEPTRGIDVGAKEEIYQIIRDLADEGLSILLVSSELPEVLSLSDRVLVLREGKLMGALKNEGLSQEKIMTLAAGSQ